MHYDIDLTKELPKGIFELEGRVFPIPKIGEDSESAERKERDGIRTFKGEKWKLAE